MLPLTLANPLSPKETHLTTKADHTDTRPLAFEPTQSFELFRARLHSARWTCLTSEGMTSVQTVEATLIWIWRITTIALFGVVAFQQFTLWLAFPILLLVIFFLILPGLAAMRG
jgi:hypothetical protein